MTWEVGDHLGAFTPEPQGLRVGDEWSPEENLSDNTRRRAGRMLGKHKPQMSILRMSN